MADADRLCQLLPLETLQDLNAQLQSATNGVKPVEIFRKFVDDLNVQLRKENQRLVDIALGVNTTKDENVVKTNWSAEETQLLIKGTTIFPVGTKSRWNVIASFINEHRKVGENGTRQKTEKDVISKVKELQKTDDKSKETVVKGVPLLRTKNSAQVETAPSQRDDADDSNTWSAEEQKLLEQALKTFSADIPDRWDKIAECLPGRTKKDCVKRYKEIAELVRARKVALQQSQSQAGNKSKSGT